MGLYRALYDHLEGHGLAFRLEEEGLESSLRTMLRSERCFLAVAEEGEELVGFLCAGVTRMDRKLSYGGGNTLGLIHDLYLTPPARKQGLAGELLGRRNGWFGRGPEWPSVRWSGTTVWGRSFGPGGVMPR